MREITVLIAEDDKISFEYLQEILRDKKAEIFLAKTGTEAIEICRNNPQIDIVLMDIKMPEMDGQEATKMIKALRPELPVVAQTAYALDDERKTILSAGFDDYLAKPIQREALLKIIEKHTDAGKTS